MCGPVAAASAAVGVAQSFAAGSAASKQARAQADYNRRLGIHQNARYQKLVEYNEKLGEHYEKYYNSVADSTKQSLNAQYGAVLERIEQSEQNANETAARYSLSSESAQAQQRVLAAENATTGNSVMLAQRAVEANEYRSRNTIYNNLKAEIRQQNRNMLAMQAQGQSRINQAMPAPIRPVDPVMPIQQVTQPSMLPYLLQGASSIIGGYVTQQQINALATPTAPPSTAHLGPLGSGGGGTSFALPPAGTNSVLI